MSSPPSFSSPKPQRRPNPTRGLHRRNAYHFRASEPFLGLEATSEPSTLPHPPKGEGGEGGWGVASSLDPLKTSGIRSRSSGVVKANHSAEWCLWATEQVERHEYRRIFCAICGELKSIPVYCKVRFCPVCSRARRMKVQERLTWLIDHTPRDPRHRLKMLTLTQENQKNLSEGVKRIVSAFKRLRQERFWKVASSSGAWVIEVTGAPNRWHIHIHALLLGSYIAQPVISNAWKKLTGAPVVDIRAVETATAVGYITKYVSKGDFDPRYVNEVADALHSVRLFNVFGLWHNAKAPKVKLVCQCPYCHGTRWFPESCLFPCTDAQARAWREQLRSDWDSALHSEGG